MNRGKWIAAGIDSLSVTAIVIALILSGHTCDFARGCGPKEPAIWETPATEYPE